MARIIQFPGARSESADRVWGDEDMAVVLYSALTVNTAGETMARAKERIVGQLEADDFTEPFAKLFGVESFDEDTRLWPDGADSVPERLASSAFDFEMRQAISANRISIQPRTVTITPVAENGELTVRLAGTGENEIGIQDFAWAWPTMNTACSALRMNVLRHCGNLSLVVRLVLPDVLR